MKKKSRTFHFGTALSFLALFFCAFHVFEKTSCASEKCFVYFVKSRSLQPYEFVASKIIEYFRAHCSDFEPVVFEMEADEKKGMEVLSAINKQRPELVVSIGTEATVFFAKNVSDIPVLFTMVYSTDEVSEALSGKDNIRGAFVNLDMESPIDVLQQIVPAMKNIGIIYLPENTSGKIDDIRAVAEKKGLMLEARPIKSEPDIPAALRELVSRVQCLYIIPSPLLSKKEVMRFIILETLRNRVFVVGESFDVVQKGALVGFGFEINRVAENTINILESYRKTRSMGGIVNKSCEKFNLFLNERTAENLNIRFPESIKKDARKIIE